MNDTHTALRQSFASIAPLYDAVRPGCPPAVLDRALAPTNAPAPAHPRSRLRQRPAYQGRYPIVASDLSLVVTTHQEEQCPAI